MPSPIGKPRVLVIDDEAIMRDFVTETLMRAGYAVDPASDGEQGLASFREGPYDLVMTDLKMPGVDGIEVVKEVRRLSPGTPVVVMTAYGTIQNAVSAMKQGAFDYVTKPLSPEEIEIVAEKAFGRKRLEEELHYLRTAVTERFSFGEMVGQSKAMLAVYDQINRVASSMARVLVTGESGTGKELVARAIHKKSRRVHGPFIKVNCAALSESLLESELFGHEKGAFTGAHQRRLGRFELAHGGTLLLDEIGEMALELQAKLLRVVQEGEVDRVGGMQPVSVDVRLICTTNRDLEQAVAAGKFREDLFFRLSVVPVDLPPLRERKEDILPLVDHFVGLFAAQNGKTVRGVDAEVADMFINHSWPGNVRELENYIERAIVLTDSDMLGRKDFSFTWLAAGKRGSETDLGTAVRVPVGATLAEAERNIILKTLDSTDQNRTRAAAVLGISVRTLRNKLSQYAQEGSSETVE